MNITNLTAKLFSLYINFVFKTSKIIKSGHLDLLDKRHTEKYIFVFWHGDSFCFYPITDKTLYILTTADRRGDYISGVAKNFNYKTFRMPDKVTNGHLIFELHKIIKNRFDLALTLDGPLGPYHEPKPLAFILGSLLKRKIVPLSVTIKHKIRLTKRWDKYVIPLPFNQIQYHAAKPIAIDAEEQKNDFLKARDAVKTILS